MLCTLPTFTGCGKTKVELGNVLILGDSYSTFDGYMVGGYESWYSTERNENHTDVFAVEDTWWWQVIDETDSTLIANSSLSGSLISNAKSEYSSFIGRFDVLKSSKILKDNQIDTVFIFGGLNDVWNDVSTGQRKNSDWTAEDLKKIFPAFCYLLNDVRTTLPNARIIVLLDETINVSIQLNFSYACFDYGAEMIVPEGVSKKNSHPNKAGMLTISTQVIEYLEKTEKESK